MTASLAQAAGPAIREIEPGDLPLIAQMHARCFADGRGGAVWSETEIAKILDLPLTFGLLAWAPDDGAAGNGPLPLGFALCRCAADEGEILSLGVVDRARRGGVGRALVDAALARGARGGARRFYLEVAEDNLAARKLYGAAGFILSGRRPNYYRRPAGPATALVFARELLSGD